MDRRSDKSGPVAQTGWIVEHRRGSEKVAFLRLILRPRPHVRVARTTGGRRAGRQAEQAEGSWFRGHSPPPGHSPLEPEDLADERRGGEQEDEAQHPDSTTHSASAIPSQTVKRARPSCPLRARTAATRLSTQAASAPAAAPAAATRRREQREQRLRLRHVLPPEQLKPRRHLAEWPVAALGKDDQECGGRDGSAGRDATEPAQPGPRLASGHQSTAQKMTRAAGRLA